MIYKINLEWLLVTVLCVGLVVAQGDMEDDAEGGGDGGGDSSGNSIGDSGNSIGDSGGNSVGDSNENSIGDSSGAGGGDSTGHSSSVGSSDVGASSNSSSTESYGNKTSRGDGYGFFRTMGERGRWVDTRRVFGGSAAKLEDFPRMCALLDRFLGARCSGAMVARRWVLTAAHCISPNLAYVKYNSRHPLRTHDGKMVAIQYLYKHPEYKVLQEDVGRGMDVTLLHHDVGLVRTRADMDLVLRTTPRRGPMEMPPLEAMHSFNAEELRDQEIQVLGYGRTETAAQGEELLEARLVVVDCDRPTWTHCVCGVAPRGESSGVCSGDSGGPVVYYGMQIGVTSMGPLECARENASWPMRATSVFTSLYHYTDIINRTMLDAEESMQKLNTPSHAPLAAPLMLNSASFSIAVMCFIHVI